MPSAADESIVMPKLPLPIPSRLSNALDPSAGLVRARPDFTMSLRNVKISLPVALSNVVLVARLLRPLLLFTYVLAPSADHCSRYQGSSFIPKPACDTVAESLSFWAADFTSSSVFGGLFGSSPAVWKAFLL